MLLLLHRAASSQEVTVLDVKVTGQLLAQLNVSQHAREKEKALSGRFSLNDEDKTCCLKSIDWKHELELRIHQRDPFYVGAH